MDCEKLFSQRVDALRAEGRYRGNLYDIGFDKPEAHVVEKDGRFYYAFYAEKWNGPIELRGLGSGSYTVADYWTGKTLGYHFVKEAPVLAMLSAAGVDQGKVKFVNTTNYDPNQVVQGKINAVGCYQSNEPLTLRAEHAQFNEFTPAQFHVTGTFNVQFFNKTFLAAHYAAAKDWMRADLRAFYYCAAHQAACVNIEGEYARQAGSEFITSHERQVWALESALALHHTLPGHGVGVQSVAEFQPEARELVHFGLMKSVPSPASAMDTTMVASLYHGKTLIWP